jgi:hypothetical protein
MNKMKRPWMTWDRKIQKKYMGYRMEMVPGE